MSPAGRHHDRHVCEPQRHVRLLKRAHHRVDVLPVAFLRLEKKQHQIGTRREVLGFVADDERREIAFRLANARLQHLNGVAADNVHLRVELDAENTVAEIHQAGARILLDDAGTLFCAAQNLEVWRGGRERGGLPQTTAAFQSFFDEWRERFPTFLYVVSGFSRTSQQIRTRFADRIEQPLNADRVDQLERPQLPAEAPPHDPVHIVGGVRDGRRDHGRIHKGRCEGVT